MASDNEASCIADPNFAVICAFLQKFGTLCGLSSVDFIDLQKMIENTQEVPQPLLDLHLKLLRRIKKTVAIERWERVLAKVCHTYNNQDGWEIERFGYKKARISCKLRTLKALLDMQFDYHTKFKNEVNKLTAEELRSQPLGRDKLGHAYWCQIDDDCQIRVYKEDPDEETWMLVARDRDGLISLINQLKENDSVITGIEPVLENEDSNSLEIEKPILDTGQPDSPSNEDKAEENEEDREQKCIKLEETKSSSPSEKEVEENGKEDQKEEALPKPLCLRLKPMSELLNSPSAAQYKAEEEAKKKRICEEPVDHSKPAKARKLTLMNSKPVKLAPKHVEESSEEDGDDEEDDEEEEELEDSDDDDEEVGEEIEEPVMYVKGRGRGNDNYAANEEQSPIIGDEVCEDVFYVFGEGSGAECQTGNENDNNKPAETSQTQKKSPIKLGMVVDSKMDRNVEGTTKYLVKKNRWDVGKPASVTEDDTVGNLNNEKPKVSMFFFGPNTNTNAGISFFGTTSSPSKDDSNNSVLTDDNVNDDGGTNSANKEETAPVVKEVLLEENHKNEAQNLKNESQKDDAENRTSREENPTVAEDLSKEKVSELEKEETDNNLDKDVCANEIKIHEHKKCEETDQFVPEEETSKELSKIDDDLNSSNITLDLSKKIENNLDKSDNITNKETAALSDHDKIITKEIKIDSNTLIIEMEIEEDDDKNEIDDSTKLGDKSGESMDIEEVIDESASKEIVLESHNLKYSCIEEDFRDMPASAESVEIEANEFLPTDLSTTNKNDCQRINNVEENLQPIVTQNADEIWKESDSAMNLIKKDHSEVVTITNKESVCYYESDNMLVSPQNLTKDKLEETDKFVESELEENDGSVNISEEPQTNAESDIVESTKEVKCNAKSVPSEILHSVESCIVSAKETVLTSVEPPAITVTTVDTTDSPSIVKEPTCLKKSIAPLTTTEEVTTLEKPEVDNKKASSPLQSIASVESIDADYHASSVDRDSELDTAEDPFDSVGDPLLGVAEEEQEDEIDEAEEEEEIEEEEEEEQGEIDPDDVEDEELAGEEDEGLEEEEIEDEELGEEEEDDDDETSSIPPEGAKIMAPSNAAGIKNAEKKTTLISFTMDFNDSSDSLNLPPMLKEKLQKRQLMREKQSKGQDGSDSDEEGDDEEEEEGGEEGDDEEVDEEEEEDDDDSDVDDADDDDDDDEEDEPPEPVVKSKIANLKGVRPPVKAIVKTPPTPPPTIPVNKSTTADLRKERKKKKTEIEILREEIAVKSIPISGVRQSRRIAQIKIREEAEKRKLEDLTLAQVKFESRKMFETAEKMKKGKLSSDEEYVADLDLDELKKRKKKKKHHKHPKFDEHNPWKSSSGSSSSQEEEQEEEAEDSDHDIRQRELKSDHEFSPESDLEDDAEVKPLKRARTVRKEDKTEEGEDEEVDDTCCEKCGKFDHPEWILLCDGCDHGWHCSCLRPALLVIPEGDWYCPPCQHATLLKKLEEQLVDLDKRRSKQQIEVRRKERLAYVGISLNNVLSSKDADGNKIGKGDGGKSDDSSSSGSSGSTDSTDSDEPIYQLRQRRQTHSYRFNDYDDLINSAIQDEEDPEEDEAADDDVAVGNQGHGKDIATIVNAEKEQREKETGIGEVATGKPLTKNVVKRKKKRKLNSLVVSSGEDGTSDEDFRGSSSDDDEEELEFDEPASSNSSYDSAIGRRRKKGAGGGMRRSTRVRWSRMDTDFINDDSDEDDVKPELKKKRNRSNWSDDSDDLDDEEELSELSDRSWSKKRKRGSSNRSSSKSKTKKSKKKKQQKEGSDSDEPVQKKKRKIKFGGLNDSDDEDEEEARKVKTDSGGVGRKTRGKKITYVDALGSDSEDELRRRKAGIVEESEEEYVADDDDGLEDEDGNEIEKDSDDSDSAAPTKVHIKPVLKKGKGKGGIKRIKRAQGIEDELFPPLKPEEPKTDDTASTTPATVQVDKPKVDSSPAKEKEVTEPAAIDPMQEINRNIESMDEKLMMEDPEYATKQLQMVAAQLERKKKEDAALSAAEAAATSEDMAKHRRGRKPKVIPYMSPSPQVLQTKLQTPEDVQENSNSPGATIPVFGELATPTDDSPAKKRRGRGKGKKTLEKEAAAAAALAVAATALGKEDLRAPPNPDQETLPTPKPPAIRATGAASPSIDPAAIATAKLAIATPPQPFSQTEPAPSVITRMLQAPQAGPTGPGTPPGSSSPVGPIPAGIPYGPPHKYYGPGPPPPLVDGRPPPPPLRGAHLPPGMPYGPPPAMGGMNHRPYHGGPPPHMMRGPIASHSPPMPPGALYHHHHTADASPSGGSAIQPIGGGSPGRIPAPAGSILPRAASAVPSPSQTSVPPHLIVPPDRHSPSSVSLGHTPPPPLIPPPAGSGGPRYPPHAAHQPPPPPRHHHMMPQHAMHGIHGLPPRGAPGPGPMPPSPYPPGSYYSTYPPPQPSSIPPEDYHHHHHPIHPYGGPPRPTPTNSQQQQQQPAPPSAGGEVVIPPPAVVDPQQSAVIVAGLKTTPAHDQEDIAVGGGPVVGGEPPQDSSGEFGGLVSYFSSQREDDLDG